jgi:hypothetical protein
MSLAGESQRLPIRRMSIGKQNPISVDSSPSDKRAEKRGRRRGYCDFHHCAAASRK